MSALGVLKKALREEESAQFSLSITIDGYHFNIFFFLFKRYLEKALDLRKSILQKIILQDSKGLLKKKRRKKDRKKVHHLVNFNTVELWKLT